MAQRPSDQTVLPSRQSVEQFLYEKTLQPWGEEVAADRLEEVQRVRRHVEISLNALIDRGQCQLAEYSIARLMGRPWPALMG